MSLTFLLLQSFNIYNSKKESVLYYYKEEVLTTETPFKNRVETNQDFTDFTVSINNVSEYDGGVYWCTFNKLDMYTNSEQTCLLVQSGTQVYILTLSQKVIIQVEKIY